MEVKHITQPKEKALSTQGQPDLGKYNAMVTLFYHIVVPCLTHAGDKP